MISCATPRMEQKRWVLNAFIMSDIALLPASLLNFNWFQQKTSSMLDQKATRKKCWVGHRVQRLQQGLREERCTISYIDCTVCIIVATQHIMNCGSKHVEKASTAQWRQASKTCVKDIFKLQNSLVFSGATTMWPYVLEANGMILIIQLLV